MSTSLSASSLLRVLLALTALLTGWSPPAAAQARIRDNLFLLEEAYNQEPGVIQHIQFFTFDPRSRAWAYSFTEEWPVPSDRHQLSVTLSAQGEPSSSGLSDLLLTYRLQALGLGGQGWLAMAPRLSLVLPTADWRSGAGRGAIGLQPALPLSMELGRRLTGHLNAGLTITPAARSAGGDTRTAIDTSAGLALVWHPLDWLNPLLEVAHLSQDLPDGAGWSRQQQLLINPGLRAAFTFASGLQVVPGLSVPVQITPGGTSVALLGYLSLEHPLWQP